MNGIEQERLASFAKAEDRCEVLCHWIQRSNGEANAVGTISIAPPVGHEFSKISRGIVALNNVRKTPNGCLDVQVSFAVVRGLSVYELYTL